MGDEGGFYVIKNNWKITCLSTGKLKAIQQVTISKIITIFDSFVTIPFLLQKYIFDVDKRSIL
jgi:hypothetical protein